MILERISSYSTIITIVMDIVSRVKNQFFQAFLFPTNQIAKPLSNSKGQSHLHSVEQFLTNFLVIRRRSSQSFESKSMQIVQSGKFTNFDFQFRDFLAH